MDNAEEERSVEDENMRLDLDELQAETAEHEIIKRAKMDNSSMAIVDEQVCDGPATLSTF